MLNFDVEVKTRLRVTSVKTACSGPHTGEEQRWSV